MHLMLRLRDSEASRYTERDTPIFVGGDRDPRRARPARRRREPGKYLVASRNEVVDIAEGGLVRAQVKETREVAKGTLMVVFDLLGREVDFGPGQYFWVTLLDPPYEDEKGQRRHITVVTSPNERGVLGLCTRLRDSAFKRSLAELPVGDEVDVEEPKGSFVLPEETDRPYVFIAGGIGITVFRCMLRYIAEEQLAAPRHARLLESRPRVGRLPRRAARARARQPEPAQSSPR